MAFFLKKKKKKKRSSHHGSVETNPTRNHEVASLIPGLAQWAKDLAGILHFYDCGVGQQL